MTTTIAAARPYRPDNHFDARGLLMLACTLILAAGALGAVAHFVSQYFYLILLFPMVIGGALGAAGAAVVRRTGMRNPWVAGLIGLAGGIFAMGMMHYFGYRSFLAEQAIAAAKDPEYVAQLRSGTGEPEFINNQGGLAMPGERERREADFYRFVRAIRVRSFAGYMDFEAREGVQIRGEHGAGSPQNLGYTGSYIYWCVEALIVAGISFAIIRGQAVKPYCAACGTWKAERAVGYLATDPKDAATAVRDGDVARLGPPAFEPSASLLHVASCPNGKACVAVPREDEVRLEKHAYDKKGKIVQRKTLAHATWPATATGAIDAIFAPATPHA